MDRAPELVVLAQAGGSSAALAILCRMLAEKDTLSLPEVEMVRQYALQGFDAVANAASTTDERESIAAARELLDGLWQKASLSAERRGEQ